MTSWLNKQRKQTLLDLSAEAGLKQDEDLRKDELIEALDGHLQKNATRLSGKSAFEPYFGTRRTPFKARSSSAAGVTSDDGEVKSVVKARGRRTTKVKAENDDGERDAASPSQALVTTTRTPARRRSELLPASPADVADDVEYAARRISVGITDLYNRSGFMERVDSLRDVCSSVQAVQMTFIFLEAWCLQREILPIGSAFEIPSVELFGYRTSSVPFGLPSFFNLLGADFWSTSLLWTTTSILIPLLVAYFFNLSTHKVKRHGTRVSESRYQVDPLTFSLTKALVTFFVYGVPEPLRLPFFDRIVAARVDHAMFYGWRGIVIGSFVGIITSLYEAAQGK